MKFYIHGVFMKVYQNHDGIVNKT